MRKLKVREIVTKGNQSIKEAMGVIDRAGCRSTYVVDGKDRLIGVVTDSEIRKAILKGIDIKTPVSEIINKNPIILNTTELKDARLVAKAKTKLLGRMPDSEFIMVVDQNQRPKELISLRSTQRPEAAVERKSRRVLVVGGAGYLGSVLTRKLLAKDFKVKVLDLLLFGREPIQALHKVRDFELVEGDMRNITVLIKALAEVDAVINLAAIVGDPACKSKPETAIETNYLANKVLSEACKYHQINRYIYASTCSVYGQMQNETELTEASSLNPVSLYARSKIQSEEGIMGLIDENFAPTIMRMSTLYGYSPRMRFDLVVNTMTKTAVADGRIIVHGGGKQWRPILHVEDAAEAYIKCLEAPLDKIKGEVFNVGSSQQNYQIIDIAKAVKKCLPQAKLVMQGDLTDARNYFVSFAKIEAALGYRTKETLERSIERIAKAIKDGEINNVNDPKYYNVEDNA